MHSLPSRHRGTRPLGWATLVGIGLTTTWLACAPSPPSADSIAPTTPAEPPVATSTASARPNILFLSLDTVRRDALGVYRDGSDEDSPTPHLDAFARDAVVFTDAVAPMPFTLTSHMSMFTGLYPDVHGVKMRERQLNESVATLPAILAEAGYRTAGFYTNDWMKGGFGFDRGFERYERLRHRLTYADRLNEVFFETIDGLASSEPWFVFLHYLDAHSDGTWKKSTLPYYAPSPFLDDVGIHPTDQRFCEGEACATAYLTRANQGDLPLSTDELGVLEALYDRGVRYLDDRLGVLFAQLRERDLYRDTLIVVISDHGEEFREHGKLIHSQPYIESVAIPLMIKLPGLARAGEQIPPLTETVDVLPTLLGALGLPAPADIQGVDRLTTVSHDGEDEATVNALVQDKHNFRRYAYYTPSFVLVHDFDGGTTEIYDRRSDPLQRRDIAAERPAVRDDLVRQLRAQVRDNRRLGRSLRATMPAETELTEEEKARLESLGYLNG